MIRIIFFIFITLCISNVNAIQKESQNDHNVDEPLWQIVSRTVAIYPRRALERSLNGCVDLAFTISKFGKPINIEIMYQYPADIFGESAKKALESYRYSPTPNNQNRVAENTQIRLEYKIESSNQRLEEDSRFNQSWFKKGKYKSN